MKYYKLFTIALLMLVSITSFAQETAIDSTFNKIKIKELQLRKQQINKQIQKEDAKRNQVLNGVSAESQEAINDKQDSICLELRSQLVAVELELKEIVPNKTAATVINQLNNIKKDDNNQNKQEPQKQNPQKQNVTKPNNAKKTIKKK